MFPGVSADSFVDTPGPTRVLGSFAAALEDANATWYDRYMSGPQDEFMFARLTVGETGYFAGAMSVAGPTGPVELPFNFVLPGTEEDLTLIDQEPTFSLAYSLDPVAQSLAAAASQIPEPSAVLLTALAGVLWTPTVQRRRLVRPSLASHR